MSVREERSVAVNAASPEWLDAYCWRCGSDQVVPVRDGRLLCAPCRHDLFESTSSGETPVGAVRRLYWEAHALERCWRCMDHPVDPADDLGLCSTCREGTAQPTPVRRRHVSR